LQFEARRGVSGLPLPMRQESDPGLSPATVRDSRVSLELCLCPVGPEFCACQDRSSRARIQLLFDLFSGPFPEMQAWPKMPAIREEASAGRVPFSIVRTIPGRKHQTEGRRSQGKRRKIRVNRRLERHLSFTGRFTVCSCPGQGRCQPCRLKKPPSRG
jgi:hypothetical protein